jgi:hypothetical protein
MVTVRRCGACGAHWAKDRDGMRTIDERAARKHLPWLGADDGTGRLISRFTAEIGAATVVAVAEERCMPQVTSLFRRLATIDPAKLVDGHVVDAGWGLLRFAARDGVLMLTEEDYGGAPDTWTDEIGPALRITNDQVMGCQMLGQPFHPIRHDDAVAHDPTALTEPTVYLERVDGGTWFVRRPDRAKEDDAELRRCPARDLLAARPEVVSVLGLPVGTVARFVDGVLADVTGSDHRTLYPLGSVLHTQP